MLLASEQLMLKLDAGAEREGRRTFPALGLNNWNPRCKATRNSLQRSRRFEVYASEKRLATNPGRRISEKLCSGFRKRELQNLQDPTQDTTILVTETKVNFQVGKVTGKGLIPVVG